MKSRKTKQAESPLMHHLKLKVLHLQRAFALEMQKLTARLSLSQQKWIAVVLGLLAGACCTSLVVSGLTKGQAPVLAPVPAISRPVYPADLPPARKSADRGRENVQQLRGYIDSLRAGGEGRLRYDSIREFRPGLLDTLNILEQYYNLK
jgi:hypothetical protein